MFRHPGCCRESTTYLERTASSRSGSVAANDRVTIVTSTSSGTTATLVRTVPGSPGSPPAGKEVAAAASNHVKGRSNRMKRVGSYLDWPVKVNVPRCRHSQGNVLARGSVAIRPLILQQAKGP